MKTGKLTLLFHLVLKNLQWIFAFLSILLIIHLLPFFSLYYDHLTLLTWQHLRMIFLAMPPAIFLGVGSGILIYRSQPRASIVLGFASIMITVPSIALFGAMIPFLAPLGAGVGTVPAVIALILYSQLPIIRNTYVGLRDISPSILRAARGMGLSPIHILLRIRLPLAAPVILSGIRTAVVLGVGVAAVAAYIGGGGLGRWIFGGIRRTYPDMMLAGALVVSLLAISLDLLLAQLQKILTSKGVGS
ncbi:MAG: ABC transporter permease subunit [Calditrichae bacterium]|nr:ABC transporter permease subunit [Calditrichia bacterium]NIW79431.1 ABC transporter permease subunit [Calditrichia bacterium]